MRCEVSVLCAPSVRETPALVHGWWGISGAHEAVRRISCGSEGRGHTSYARRLRSAADKLTSMPPDSHVRCGHRARAHVFSGMESTERAQLSLSSASKRKVKGRRQENAVAQVHRGELTA